MGRQADAGEARITGEAIEAYLRRHGHPDARVEHVTPLGRSVQASLKGYGYGRPLRVGFRADGATHDMVLRTMAPDPFGHDRRADRVAALVLARDTFDGVPRHIRPHAVGAFAADGTLVPLPEGEPFLLTEYVEGALYAEDLHALRRADAPSPGDLDRVDALARYLAALHAEPAPADAYLRCVRDTLGSGEGIFGLCDSYPAGDLVASPARLTALERAAVDWRWRLKATVHRARRTHGDFHPFNLLFREGADLSVLDCSRGGAGEPADDVTCLSLNYLFFALVARGEPDGALRALWDRFWRVYLDTTGDVELLTVVAPFFTWRALVLASPLWYPDVPPAIRDRLLRFAERLLGGAAFRPDEVDELLR